VYSELRGVSVDYTFALPVPMLDVAPMSRLRDDPALQRVTLEAEKHAAAP
jgi:hypothetical protein